MALIKKKKVWFFEESVWKYIEPWKFLAVIRIHKIKTVGNLKTAILAEFYQNSVLINVELGKGKGVVLYILTNDMTNDF